MSTIIGTKWENSYGDKFTMIAESKYFFTNQSIIDGIKSESTIEKWIFFELLKHGLIKKIFK